MRGRKPKAESERLGRVIKVCLTAGQHQKLEAAAKLCRQPISVFVRSRALHIANMVITKAATESRVGIGAPSPT